MGLFKFGARCIDLCSVLLVSPPKRRRAQPPQAMGIGLGGITSTNWCGKTLREPFPSRNVCALYSAPNSRQEQTHYLSLKRYPNYLIATRCHVPPGPRIYSRPSRSETLGPPTHQGEPCSRSFRASEQLRHTSATLFCDALPELDDAAMLFSRIASPRNNPRGFDAATAPRPRPRMLWRNRSGESPGRWTYCRLAGGGCAPGAEADEGCGLASLPLATPPPATSSRKTFAPSNTTICIVWSDSYHERSRSGPANKPPPPQNEGIMGTCFSLACQARNSPGVLSENSHRARVLRQIVTCRAPWAQAQRSSCGRCATREVRRVCRWASDAASELRTVCRWPDAKNMYADRETCFSTV